MHSKQLKLKTIEYLATRKQPKPLEDIVKYFEVISSINFNGVCKVKSVARIFFDFSIEVRFDANEIRTRVYTFTRWVL